MIFGEVPKIQQNADSIEQGNMSDADFASACLFNFVRKSIENGIRKEFAEAVFQLQWAAVSMMERMKGPAK